MSLADLFKKKTQEAELSHESFAQMQVALQELQTKVESVSAVNQELADKLAITQELMATAVLAAQDAEQKLAQYEQAAADEAMAVRKKLIVDTVGEARADATFEAVKGLDGAAFDAVLAALSNTVEAEAKSEGFQELGVSGVASAAAVQESLEMKLLKQKYSKK